MFAIPRHRHARLVQSAAHVRIGRSREEILAHLDAGVGASLTPAELEAQLVLASTMTWDANLA